MTGGIYRINSPHAVRRINSRRPVSSGGEPWYLAGGIDPANCIAAYQPIGAASYEASKVNLANPGTYDADDEGAHAPRWDELNGWSSNYLKTGIVPSSGWSAIVSYSGASGLGVQFLFGGDDLSSARFLVIGNYSNKIYYGNGGVLTVAPGLESGIVGISGNKGYRNGIADAGTMGAWSGTGKEIYLCGTNANGSPQNIFGGYIQMFAVYNTVLSADIMLELTSAMNAVAVTTWITKITYASTIGV